jgi:hypothetical protein
LACAAIAQADSPAQETPLGDIARQYRGSQTPSRPSSEPSTTASSEPSAPLQAGDDDGQTSYQRVVQEMLSRSDYEALDAEANRVGESKERFPGGVWKLFVFYEAVADPDGGKDASRSSWITHIYRLKRWVAADPQSPTALVALAQGYVDFGFQQRGTGSSDAVSEEGWQGLHDSTRLAMETLARAAALPKRSPQWYYTMQDVAMAGGAPPEFSKKLLKELIELEPGYYHFYREMANYLQPKWYGEPGDVERFANQVSARLGGHDGQFVYFEIASIMYCDCGDDRPHDFSWTKIKQGYDAMQKLYGTSNVKLNRYALIATKFNDRPAARQAFAAIGENWDQKTWRKESAFEKARLWAQQQ